MSLKEKDGMLGIDHQHGRHRGHEPGADSGVSGWRRRGAVCRPAAVYERTKFATRYTHADIHLLAYVYKAHANLSGPATRRILEWEYSDYEQADYVRLASISVAHLYRLRNNSAYRKRNTSCQPTRPTPIPIGERRKPQPRGQPVFCASTPYTREINKAGKVYITSMPSTK
jgi:hypothetical protein